MMQTIKFSKMHGLGNDFVITHHSINHLEKNLIQQLSSRHTGIGFDQLLLVSSSEKADFSCRIFNADGSEAEQCGNGMRCVARYVHEANLTTKNNLSIETKSGVVSVVIHDYDNIQVKMGTPKLEHQNLSLTDISLPVLCVLSIGNPHAILQTSHDSNLTMLGKKIATHSFFPNGVNVGFMEIVNRNKIRLRTYERGVGETLACGSNACAAVVAGISNNLLDSKVEVELALGSLSIEWAGKEKPVLMTGSASRVFDGQYKIK